MGDNIQRIAVFLFKSNLKIKSIRSNIFIEEVIRIAQLDLEEAQAHKVLYDWVDEDETLERISAMLATLKMLDNDLYVEILNDFTQFAISKGGISHGFAMRAFLEENVDRIVHTGF